MESEPELFLDPEQIILNSHYCYLGEDICLAEDEESALMAEDLDISAVQPTATTSTNGSSNSNAEKPAPKNVFYFYQVLAKKREDSFFSIANYFNLLSKWQSFNFFYLYLFVCFSVGAVLTSQYF